MAAPIKEGYVFIQKEAAATGYRLYTRISRPTLLDSEKVPLVVLHGGGPSLPSDYLLPLEKLCNRSVIFYDQLGCGRSDRPEDNALYSVKNMADDLQLVLEATNIKRCHLLGHSWGGILAFEYLRCLFLSSDPNKIRVHSVVLANTPASIPMSEEDKSNLIQRAIAEEGGDRVKGRRLFSRRHNCAIEPWPDVLRAAHDHAGTMFYGTTAIQDWAPSPRQLEEVPKLPVLCLRGERDFVSQECIAIWNQLPGPVSQKTLARCGHMPHLEDPLAFNKLVDDFLGEHDERR